MSQIETPLFKRFSIIGNLEGISFLLLLFIAMPLKYALGIPEAVKYVGWAHGLLFVLYLYFLIQCSIEFKWSFMQAALGFMAAVLPFGPFVFHRWIKQQMVKPH